MHAKKRKIFGAKGEFKVLRGSHPMERGHFFKDSLQATNARFVFPSKRLSFVFLFDLEEGRREKCSENISSTCVSVYERCGELTVDK